MRVNLANLAYWLAIPGATVLLAIGIYGVMR